MHFPHIAKLDLRLIEPLYALLEERGVTRAAKRCSMNQSTMSRALERLRTAFHDELLVRTDGGYERTLRGDQLLHDLQELLPRLDATIRGKTFDAASSRECFRIATTDYAASILIPALVERVARGAPGAGVDIAQWNDSVIERMESGRIHLAIIGSDNLQPFDVEPLFTDEFVCVVAKGHPLRDGRVTLKRYLEYGHAVVSIRNGGQQWIEGPLAALGFRRTVAYRTPYQLSAVVAASRSTMICTTARRLANQLASVADVRILSAPRELPTITYHMAWHRRLREDAAQNWMRMQVRLSTTDLHPTE